MSIETLEFQLKTYRYTMQKATDDVEAILDALQHGRITEEEALVRWTDVHNHVFDSSKRTRAFIARTVKVGSHKNGYRQEV